MKGKNIFTVIFTSTLFLTIISCSNPTGPEGTISDYLTLSVSGREPAISFPRESEGQSSTATFSNITYNSIGQVTSFNFSAKFESSGNTYDIFVSRIERNIRGATTAYTASTTATIGGKKISGTLTYP